MCGNWAVEWVCVLLHATDLFCDFCIDLGQICKQQEIPIGLTSPVCLNLMFCCAPPDHAGRSFRHIAPPGIRDVYSLVQNIVYKSTLVRSSASFHLLRTLREWKGTILTIFLGKDAF